MSKLKKVASEVVGIILVSSAIAYLVFLLLLPFYILPKRLLVAVLVASYLVGLVEAMAGKRRR